MKTRIMATVIVIFALVAPVATAKLIPTAHVKRHVAPRVLCICSVIPASALPVHSEVELEGLADVELIANGLDPSYASFQATPELKAEYDAVLVANGLPPYFGVAAPTAGG